MAKKHFFAQTNSATPHKSKYFFTLKEAVEWVENNGGGSVKKRNATVIHHSGYGLGKVEFNPPLRVWGEVYQSKAK